MLSSLLFLHTWKLKPGEREGCAGLLFLGPYLKPYLGKVQFLGRGWMERAALHSSWLMAEGAMDWGCLFQGAARNPEDMDRERREHEREERMGQLRGSATRALPPGPPAGATANRLRNVAEPMASTPTSRIQQSGEYGEREDGGGPKCT